MIKLLNDNLKRKADRLTKKSEKVFPKIYIYTNILKGVRKPGTVPRGALPKEF